MEDAPITGKTVAVFTAFGVYGPGAWCMSLCPVSWCRRWRGVGKTAVTRYTRTLRMERRQNSRAAWSKRQSAPCNRVPQLQRGPGVIEVIKGTATARSGQLTMPCPVCAQRRYDDVIGNFRA